MGKIKINTIPKKFQTFAENR